VWPDLAAKPAGANLRVPLASLLELVEPDREPTNAWFVRTNDGRLQLAVDGVAIDVRAFAAHIEQARNAERSGAPSLALDHFRDALALYRGDFLPDLDEPAVDQERRRLQALAFNAGCRAAELLLAKGEPEAALQSAIAARRVDPTAERAARTEIRCHLALGSETSAKHVARQLHIDLSGNASTPERETMQLLASLHV
jgi:two-component SAPR family response regulator